MNTKRNSEESVDRREDMDQSRVDQKRYKSDQRRQSNDPWTTPGTAEGDRETVEADIKDKERKGMI
ncbi:MAG TPA: hypothetical protein VFC63_00160 [Blastocatellia bacterium]|nr:hypothetical protein [Blastocatellia bacterium]